MGVPFAVRAPESVPRRIKLVEEPALADVPSWPPDAAESFMRQALDEALRARDLGEIPIGAVVVDPGGTVVSRGHNRTISEKDPSAHAEVVAIRGAAVAAGNHRLAGYTLFTTVEPCLMCLGAALHGRIARLVYGTTDPKVGATGALKALRETGAGFNHRFETTGGVLAEEAAELLTRFFREKRNRPEAEGESNS